MVSHAGCDGTHTQQPSHTVCGGTPSQPQLYFLQQHGIRDVDAAKERFCRQLFCKMQHAGCSCSPNWGCCQNVMALAAGMPLRRGLHFLHPGTGVLFYSGHALEATWHPGIGRLYWAVVTAQRHQRNKTQFKQARRTMCTCTPCT